MKLIPLRKLGLTKAKLKEHCEYIIKEHDRYTPERVFEAKEILIKLPKIALNEFLAKHNT